MTIQPKDFGMAELYTKKSRVFAMVEEAISNRNYGFAKNKIEELIEWYPQNQNYQNIKNWLEDNNSIDQ